MIFPKVAMIVKTTHTSRNIFVAGIVGMFAIIFTIGSSELAYADGTGHNCFGAGNHCYDRIISKWCVLWCGEREESGVKGTQVIPSSFPTVVSGHNVAYPYWVTFGNDWVEIGWIHGGTNTVCGNDAVTNPKYYWRAQIGATPYGGCSSTTPSAGNATFELSDLNQDGKWDLYINGAKATTTVLDMGNHKGKLIVGGESDNDNNGMEGENKLLKYLDQGTTTWTNWDEAGTQVEGGYSLDWCTYPTHFEFGDSPSC